MYNNRKFNDFTYYSRFSPHRKFGYQKNFYRPFKGYSNFGRKKYTYIGFTQKTPRSKFKYKKTKGDGKENGNLSLNQILGRRVYNLSNNVYKFVNAKAKKSQQNDKIFRNRFNSTDKLKYSHNRRFSYEKNYALSKTKFACSFTNRLVNRSIKCLTKPSNQQYCKFFNKLGRCHKGIHCHDIHDPARISVCTRFLKGTCQMSNCLFSHKVSPQRMPVCSFFLRGTCSKGQACMYRHVKVNIQAEVCKDFLNGLCSAGVFCKLKHDDTCTEFASKGTCSLGRKCLLRHVFKKNAIRINNNNNNEVKKSSKSYIKKNNNTSTCDSKKDTICNKTNKNQVKSDENRINDVMAFNTPDSADGKSKTQDVNTSPRHNILNNSFILLESTTPTTTYYTPPPKDWSILPRLD